MGASLRRFVRDPFITIANSRRAVFITLTLTVLIFAAVFCALEQSNPRLQGHAKYGYWVACYWAITTMTTVGYGDVSAPDAAGQFVSCVLMLWSTFFLLPIAVVNVFNGVWKDRDKFSHEEQEELKHNVALIAAHVEHLRSGRCTCIWNDDDQPDPVNPACQIHGKQHADA